MYYVYVHTYEGTTIYKHAAIQTRETMNVQLQHYLIFNTKQVNV